MLGQVDPVYWYMISCGCHNLLDAFRKLSVGTDGPRVGVHVLMWLF